MSTVITQSIFFLILTSTLPFIHCMPLIVSGTNNQYAWDQNGNPVITIPADFSKEFYLTFDANPEQDLDIGLYSSQYYNSLSGVTSKNYTASIPEDRLLSAIIEFGYGGWNNSQSVIRVEAHNKRSRYSKEILLPHLTIKSPGEFNSYQYYVKLTNSSLIVSLSLFDKETHKYQPLLTIDSTQNDEAFKKITMALFNNYFTGFTHIGFLGYGKGYKIYNALLTKDNPQEISPAAAQFTLSRSALQKKIHEIQSLIIKTQTFISKNIKIYADLTEALTTTTNHLETINALPTGFTHMAHLNEAQKLINTVKIYADSIPLLCIQAAIICFNNS